LFVIDPAMSAAFDPSREQHEINKMCLSSSWNTAAWLPSQIFRALKERSVNAAGLGDVHPVPLQTDFFKPPLWGAQRGKHTYSRPARAREACLA